MTQIESVPAESSLRPEIGQFPGDLLQNPLTYNRQFPFLAPTQRFVDSFCAAGRPEFQTAVIHNFGGQVIRNPFLVSRVFDNLRIITFLGEDPRAASLLPGLFNHLRRTVPPREVLLGWSSEQIQYLFDSSYDHFPEVSEVAQALKPHLLAAPHNPQELVNFYYRAALAMATSWQSLARMELYERIRSQQSALSPNVSVQISRDPANRSGQLTHQYEQISDAMEVMGKLLTVQGRLRGRQRIGGTLTGEEAVQAWIESLHLDESDPIGQVLAGKVIPEIRYALEHREQVHAGEAITTVPIELADGLNLSVFSSEDLTPEVRANTVREIYRVLLGHSLISRMGTLAGDVAELHINGLRAGDFRFLAEGNLSFILEQTDPNEESYGRLATVLEYHRPELTDEERQKIAGKIAELRQYINDHLRRDVRKDGYLAVLSSHHLRKLGYRHITFKPRGKLTLAEIIESGEQHTVVLDDKLQIQPNEDLRAFVHDDDKLWLELLLLSVLKLVHCYSVKELYDQLPRELKRDHATRFRNIRLKNEHLKHLEPGQHPSDRQRKLFAESELRQRKYESMTLDEVNEQKRASLESGLWTFVKKYENQDLTTTPGPIRLAIQDAADEIQSVVSLGTLSNAEIGRISSEILGDLIL